MTEMWDWKAHVEQDWAGMGDKLILHRRVGDRFEVLTGFTDTGFPIVEPVDPQTQVHAIRLPEGALAAIAEAMKPGLSSTELKVLNEALALERNRVDNMLYVLKEGLGGGLVSRTD